MKKQRLAGITKISDLVRLAKKGAKMEEMIQKVMRAMLYMKNESFSEKYPLSLIDINTWEWPQGVGIYGLYQYYQATGSKEILDFLIKWYDDRIREGIKEKNINTTSPMITLIELANITGREDYWQLCREWVDFLKKDLIRTGDGAFQHMITGDPNNGQILIDTLFMALLFLKKAEKYFKQRCLGEEAEKQLLIHIEYLYDKKAKLFYHGWDFNEWHNYGEVHWARGNSWYTLGILDFLEIALVPAPLTQFFLNIYRRQCESLRQIQHDSGLWHTILDDPSSYLETSASAAFAYGILKGVRMGYLPEEYSTVGQKALTGVCAQVDASGVVQGVSYGTPIGWDADFYRRIPLSPMTYGQALTLLALLEGIKSRENSAEQKMK